MARESYDQRLKRRWLQKEKKRVVIPSLFEIDNRAHNLAPSIFPFLSKRGIRGRVVIDDVVNSTMTDQHNTGKDQRSTTDTYLYPRVLKTAAYETVDDRMTVTKYKTIDDNRLTVTGETENSDTLCENRDRKGGYLVR